MTAVATLQSLVKRSETKFGSTKLEVTKAAAPTKTSVPPASSSSSSTVTLSASLAKPEFRKPVSGKVSIALATKPSICQYCDKSFVKNQAMATHLREKCEKIPAAIRRQLLKNDITNNVTSKQKQRDSLRLEYDSISKYSRFFINISNDTTALQSDEVEKGLKNLRAELRKTKGITGITRTPSKTLRCHICKKHFLDCVDYAEHIANHET